ncbi:MAG: site-specific integrase [Prevotella sp.]|nr:site-specific integrase [Prevotella sp.]
MKFLKYIGMVAGGLRKEGKHTTMENFLYAKKRLAGYLQSQGKKDVSTGEVDRELINGFCDYLVADGVGISTISSYLSIFRTTLNKASREGLATVLDKGENPFADMRIKPLRKTEGTAYGRDVYQKLQELDIRQQLLNGSDSPDTTRFKERLENLLMARDLFLFCFCACGMEFSDLCFLKKTDMVNDTITYCRRKTGLEVKIRVLPKMQELMDRWPSKTMYVFPILQTVSKEKTMAEYKQALGVYNKRLKVLSRMLGEDIQLSSVSPRESWAVAAFEGGMALPMITKTLGYVSDAATIKFLSPLLKSRPMEDISEEIVRKFLG